MPTDRLSIEAVRVRDLPAFVRDVDARRERFGVVPITPERAGAHARNPAADPDQTGLLVAYLDGRCVGYLGLLPILLDNHGRHVKVDCLSSFYVAPEHRQTGAGSLLVLKAMSQGRDLIAVGTSEAATRLFLALGFARAGPLHVVKIRIEALLWSSFALGAMTRRLEGTSLRRLGVVTGAAQRLLRVTIDAALGRLLVRVPRRHLRGTDRDVIVRPASRVRDLESRSPGPPALRFVRDEATVNWMVACPWIAEDGDRPSGYVFSHRRDVFRMVPLEMRRRTDEENLGYIVLSVSSKNGLSTLKILDHVLRDERLRARALSQALREAVRWSADTLEASKDWWPLVAASPLLRSVASVTDKTYLVYAHKGSGALGDRVGELKVGYCDGEAPYT